MTVNCVKRPVHTEKARLTNCVLVCWSRTALGLVDRSWHRLEQEFLSDSAQSKLFECFLVV